MRKTLLSLRVVLVNQGSLTARLGENILVIDITCIRVVLTVEQIRLRSRSSW